MTPQDFRHLALALPEATEGSHMGHADFRVGGKIFATLGYPDQAWAMVKVNPEQQHELIHTEPASFVPVKGAWGLRGCTSVRLKAAKKTVVRKALGDAWRNTAPKTLTAPRGK